MNEAGQLNGTTDLLEALNKHRAETIDAFQRELTDLMKKYDVNMVPVVTLYGDKAEWQIKVITNK